MTGQGYTRVGEVHTDPNSIWVWQADAMKTADESGLVLITEGICWSLAQQQLLAQYRGQTRWSADSAWAPAFQERQPADDTISLAQS